ncbi:2-dehydropantoate 2-reductase [Pullulanibacillus sp. KACC 23026]|uniref:2-dehydropantoate 2-reductase n=1 Tax=Pullulanibacillus sp. KACC 23026 TaxID=3028315 RepID=UPI0023AFEF95|nr:2-dehydropantoate 2-reductase [Pullulanibacillus sp. KACC 23026]WEG11672.1 2-dehydropantoate 2-reductase [Pullulanibacillus sp. KACC 23026]
MTSIGVIGAGAIGMLLASVISQYQAVSLYVRREEQRALLIQNGITQLDEANYKQGIQIKPAASPWEEELMIIAVKQPALPALLKEHAVPRHPEQAIVFLQNGMGHLPLMKALDYQHLFVGIVEHGVRKVQDDVIDWNGKGQIKMGVFKGDSDKVSRLCQIPSLNVQLVKDWQPLLEDKLLVNAIINPLTALYKITNGEVFENPFFRSAAHSIFLELADALTIPDSLRKEKWNYIELVGQATAKNRSSMLQDLDANRKTEIDAILGYMMTQHPSLPKPLTSFLYHSIKGLEGVRSVNANFKEE